ncbi:DUF2125 domain-containing protein [Celeribacter litoreus]|uniref:DUF2125 domain-containing protein n=1 Tax=Celeribacter litoreus TaxID=2876714 RepID=UPI001CCD0DF7|nr:DUF2125 domain-containing protein [Celeribacter litoreus]MCA0042748.1 DUF2125 domain-containing protein [Celeribacter litoreus]
MRKVLWLLLTAVVLYFGYWMIGAKGTEAAISEWIAAREREGWQAEVAEIETKGFPLRFDTEIVEPRFADPRTGAAFSTPRLEILSESHRPTRFTARLANEVTLASPYQRLEITQDMAEADLFVAPGPNLTLERAATRIEGFTLASTLDWGLTIDRAEIMSEQRADAPLTHDITIRAAGVEPTGGLLEQLDPEGLLSDSLDVADVKIAASFDSAWDIHALEGPRPQPTRVEIETLSLDWGSLSLKVAGEFAVDTRGYPNGTIAIKAVNWREMIELAVASGAIPPDMSNLAMRAGQMLANMSGRKDTIDAELTLKNGMISMGFIPLGPAPKIALR